MKIGLRFGALAPSLAEQLDKPPKSVELWQKDADAITRLLVRGLIPDTYGQKARRKLLATIVRTLAARPTGETEHR
jgi:hypothetical protein